LACWYEVDISVLMERQVMTTLNHEHGRPAETKPESTNRTQL
jgi:hypothetical protein